VLVTAHRRENFGLPIRQICQALRVLSERFGTKCNLSTRPSEPKYSTPVHEILAVWRNVHLVDPWDYLSLIH
jgi:UDP-N-acetylglucosamine 2-epimerase (non-hydrolysing)